MKTVQDIFDEINEQQLSITKMMLKDRAAVRASKTPGINCPNCGAPRQGRSCEYCGTVFISDYKEEDELEAQQKLLDALTTIRIVEQQRQMMQSIIPYRFNPIANASQCCCSIQDSIQRQYNAQMCSIFH